MWKLANVPIFKKGKKEDLGNYRSISVTLVPGKTVEKISLEAIKKKTLQSLSKCTWVLEGKVMLYQLNNLSQQGCPPSSQREGICGGFFGFGKAFDSLTISFWTAFSIQPDMYTISSTPTWRRTNARFCTRNAVILDVNIAWSTRLGCSPAETALGILNDGGPCQVCMLWCTRHRIVNWWENEGPTALRSSLATTVYSFMLHNTRRI